MRISICCAAFASLLAAGCATQISGAHIGMGSKPQDPCAESFLNSSGPMSWFNGSLGAAGGLPRPVASLSGAGAARVGDRMALKLPGDSVDGLAAFACYATAHFQDGTSQDGVLSVADLGANRPLQIRWIDRATVEQARATYAADTQRRQQESIAYGARLQACAFQWKVAVEARAMLRSGMAEQVVEENLVATYAYGPQGQAYRDSQGTEAAVRQVTAAVALSPEQRAAEGAPDYASQQFLDRCALQVATPVAGP